MKAITSKGKRFFASTLTAALVLALAFIFSCTSNIEMPPSPDNFVEAGGSSSSTGSSSSSSGVSSSSRNSSSSLSSSSNGGISSSSSYTPGCTAANNTQTQYCSSGTMKTYGFVTYEEQTYKTVVIGNQTWMAENLNYDAIGRSTCYNTTTNCSTYGRLYDWPTAMGLASSCNASICNPQIEAKHQGICPSGWHIPSYAEWTALINYAESNKGCSSCGGASTHLKATSGWYSGSNGLDTYGFSALPGGSSYSGFDFHDDGISSYWWSASEMNETAAYALYMIYYDEYLNYGGGYSKSGMFSVRCLKD